MNNEAIRKEDREAIDSLFRHIIISDMLFQALSVTADEKLGELGIFGEDVYPYVIGAAVRLAAEHSAGSMGFFNESTGKNTMAEQLASKMFSVIDKSMANMKLNGGKQDG